LWERAELRSTGLRADSQRDGSVIEPDVDDVDEPDTLENLGRDTSAQPVDP
jgi:hypothetical protein